MSKLERLRVLPLVGSSDGPRGLNPELPWDTFSWEVGSVPADKVEIMLIMLQQRCLAVRSFFLDSCILAEQILLGLEQVKDVDLILERLVA